MLPDDLVLVDEVPMSANGKVDRRAVRALVDESGAGDEDRLEPLRGAVEKELAGLWAELLGVLAVGRARTFFDLGGDSLVATRLVEAVRVRYGLTLSLREFAAASTVARLAALVEEHRARRADEFEEGVV
jgi:acyl carrier protein